MQDSQDVVWVGSVDTVLILMPQRTSVAILIVRIARRDKALVLPHPANEPQRRGLRGEITEVTAYSRRDEFAPGHDFRAYRPRRIGRQPFSYRLRPDGAPVVQRPATSSRRSTSRPPLPTANELTRDRSRSASSMLSVVDPFPEVRPRSAHGHYSRTGTAAAVDSARLADVGPPRPREAAQASGSVKPAP